MVWEINSMTLRKMIKRPERKEQTGQIPFAGNSNSSITLIIFFLSIAGMLIYNYTKFQSFYYELPDGNLYLSVAQNFIQNGHFIQNARTHEVNMVVPPGVPLIYTVILGLTYSHINIIFFQYVLYGLSAVFLAKAAGIFSRAAFWLVPSLFVSASFYVGMPNPSTLLTETHTIFLMCLSLYLLLTHRMSVQRKVLLLVPIQFFTFLIRPVLGGLLAISLAAMAFLSLRKRLSVKYLARYLALFAAVMALNTYVNYRETGYVIPLESYGAIPMYQANNPNTQTHSYSSELAYEFADGYFHEIYTSEDLDTYQKNTLLKERASEFIKKNLPFVLRNAKIKYGQFYLKSNWNWNFYLFFISLAVFIWRKSLSPAAALILTAAFVLSTIIPAFGLYVFRYSIPCIPFYTLFNGTLYCLVGEAAWRRVAKPEEPDHA